MASTTFDLPDPLGPTTTLTLFVKSMFVFSENDLKPLIFTAFWSALLGAVIGFLTARGDMFLALILLTVGSVLLALLSIFSVALGFSLNAQTYFSEDFSGGLGQFTSYGVTVNSTIRHPFKNDKTTTSLSKNYFIKYTKKNTIIEKSNSFIKISKNKK